MVPRGSQPISGGRARCAFWFAVVPLVLLLPGLVYAGWLVRDANSNARRQFEASVSNRAAAVSQSVARTLTSLISTVNILLSGPAFGPDTRKTFLSQAASGLDGTGIVLFVRDKSTKILGISTTGADAGRMSEAGMLAAKAALATSKPQYSVFGSGQGKQQVEGFDLWIASGAATPEPLLVQVHVPASYLTTLLDPAAEDGKWLVALSDSGGRAIAQFGDGVDNLFRTSIPVPGPGWQLSIGASSLISEAMAQRNWTAFSIVSLLLAGLTIAASRVATKDLSRDLDGLSFNIGALAQPAQFKQIGQRFPPFKALMQTVTDTKAALDKRYEEAQVSPERLRMALAAAGLGSWQWDRVSRKFNGDEDFARLFGVATGDAGVSYRAYLAKIQSEDRGRLLSQLRSVLQRPHTLSDDIRVERKDGEIRWLAIRGVALTDPSGRAQGLVGTCQDVTDTKRSAKRTEQLLREVTHRSKNMLALVLAMARLTAREAPNIESHLKDFSLRVAGLSASQDLIVESDWQNVDLGALAVAQIRATASSKADRLSISGPSFLLTPEAAQTIGMILTELTLNALAHGALADPRGHVRLTWELTSDDEIKLSWRETGGLGFEPGKPAGYGMAAVERFSIQGLKVSAGFLPETSGFTWSLVGPIENLGVRPRSHRT